MGTDRLRPVWAEIDVAAVRHNAALLTRLCRPTALCAVVKADGYGHGAVDVARAALEGGASWLAVALVEEGMALRQAGVEVPVLLLSEPPEEAMAEAVRWGLEPTVYSEAGIAALSRAADRAGGRAPFGTQLKVDTGMHRVGVDPSHALDRAASIASAPSLALTGLWTHLASADGAGPDDRRFTEWQIQRFITTVDELDAAGLRPPMLHASNSAAAITHPAARMGMVRCGIALYGVLPAPELARVLADGTGGGALLPVLSLHARVSAIQTLDAGERPSYGRRRPLACRSVVATVPIGYADGVPRRLFDTGGEVLIDGRRRPLAGVVTMDQIVVDCGPADAADVAVGNDVVLLGRQGEGEVTVDEWAARLGTISYEVLCAIGPRVPRVLVGQDR